LLTNGAITLHYEDKTKVVAAGDERFAKVLQAIREEKWSTIPEIVEPELYFKSQGLDLVDGLVVVRGEAMPPELNARIAAYQANKIPFKSLLKFWENLKLNPSFNSRQQLFKFLENKGHSITEDGCFIGYRGVTEDFKDRHTRTMSNAIGSICEMPREMVDDNPDNTCSHGLHVGGYEYAKDFGSNGKLVMVKVNPKDVVAVPNDYNGQKMRVCKFEVLKETTEFLQKHVVAADGAEDIDLDEEFAEFEEEDFFEHDEMLCEDCQAEEEYQAEPVKAISKLRYKNNHAKRGPDGKFIAKKSKSKTKKAKRA
jgi:hypothetical protein